MHCHDARRMLDAGITPGASEATRTLLGFHLSACPECRAHRRRRDDQRLLDALMAQQPVAPARPLPRARRRPVGARAAGAAAIVCGALVLGAGLRPAVAAPSSAPPAAPAAALLAQQPAAQRAALKQAKASPASARHTVYVSMAVVESAAAPATSVESAVVPAAVAMTTAPAGVVEIAPKAELLSAVELVAGQEIIIPALPVGTAAEQVAPQRVYVVKSGDTLWDIAVAFYGNGGLWGVIFDANREIIRNPNLIYPNQSFVIPAILGQNPPVVTSPGGQTGAGGIYVVRSGDTLSHIALWAYGNAGAWPTIFNANRGVIGDNPHFILPGQQLQIPR